MKEKFIEHRTKILIGVLIIVVLTGAFIWGGNYPKHTDSATTAAADKTLTDAVTLSGKDSSPSAVLPSNSAPAVSDSSAQSSPSAVNPGESPKPTPSGPSQVYSGSKDYSELQGMTIDPKTGKDQYQTRPVPEGKPVPVEPQNITITNKIETCTLSVSCKTILDNMALLDEDKWELVPKDGVIFAAATVSFYEGESVFNVLRREMKKAGIQMEFKNTPVYNSAYIEGINNLYEFDVGELSGWMYKVNGWFPNYGCSRYQLHQSDAVEWVYTCDLGKDVGGYYSTEGRKSQ